MSFPIFEVRGKKFPLVFPNHRGLQKAGTNNTIRLRNSRRPKTIQRIQTILEKGEREVMVPPRLRPELLIMQLVNPRAVNGFW